MSKCRSITQFVFFRVQCLSDLTQLQQHGGSGRLAQIAAAKSTEMLDSPSTGRNKLKRDSFASGKTDDRNRSTEQLLQEKDDWSKEKSLGPTNRDLTQEKRTGPRKEEKRSGPRKS